MRIALLFLSVFINFSLLSQDTVKTYLDAKWKSCDKSKASFYRIKYKKSKKLWSVNDFYMSGQLQMSGFYTSAKMKKKTGLFTYFYDTGNKSSEGAYTKNKKIGIWKKWYKNKELDNKGEFNKGKMDGEWEYFFKNGNTSSKEIYKEGEIISFTFWEEDGSRSTKTKYQEQAAFDGDLINYIKSSVVYPVSAREANITGKVYVQFVVRKDGSITNVKVLRGIGGGCDREAIRIVKNMPSWIPGKEHNRKVDMYFNLPINFILR